MYPSSIKHNWKSGGGSCGVDSLCLLLPLLMLSLHFHPVVALPEIIRLGGLFDVTDRFEETAFRHAVERVNEDPNLLPRSRLSAQLEKIPSGDSFHSSKKVCQLLSDGVGVVIGPQTPSSASHVQSVCDAVEVPHIETHWDFRSIRGNYVINLFPHPSVLTRAYADLITAWGWDKYIIIYEDNESLVRLQDILKESNPSGRQAFVKQLPPDDDYRPLFKSLRLQADISNLILDCDSSKISKIFEHARETGMMKDKKYFVTSLDLHTLNPEDYTHPDINITAFRLVDPSRPKVQHVVDQWRNLVLFGFPNRTFSSHYFVDDSMSLRNRGRQTTTPASEPIPLLPNNMMKTETALMYDAVELTAKALHALGLDTSQPQRIEFKSLNCKRQNIGKNRTGQQQGFIVLQALRKTLFEGLTGIVEIDPATGFRTEVQLDVLDLTRKLGLMKIGTWDSRRQGDRLSWTRTAEETLKQQEEDLKDKTFTVTTKLTVDTPFWMQDSQPKSAGSERNTNTNSFLDIMSYAVDLIDELSKALQFKYVIKKVNDNKYGSPDNRTGQWNGMIGEILTDKADIAIADLTINYDRERAVDFTMPFMNLGISILYKKPAKKPPSLFSFLEPFSPDVWIYMATAFLGVSLILFVLARITPYDWLKPPPCSPDHGEILENQFSLVNSIWFALGSLMQQGCDILPAITPYQWLNPHPCKDDPDELENDLGLNNSLWFSLGSLMQQGSDIAPKAASTRTVAGMWWFFTLIMISSYTANLAAFLTSEGLEEGITEVKSLPTQTKVKYGCVGSGTTAGFFRDSTFPLYKEIWNNMNNMKPSPFVDGNSEGIGRVNKSAGTYAYFMESVSIEYITQRDCQLTQLGGLLDSKGYGIGLKKNSKYRDAFNAKVLEFAEQGVLEKLKHRWWIEKGGGKCPAVVASAGGANPLTLGNVGGVFVVLLGGCAAACFMAGIEFMWKSRKLARNEGRRSTGQRTVEHFWAEIMKELRFALQCQGEKKPVKKSKPSTENPSLAGSVPYLAFAKREPSD